MPRANVERLVGRYIFSALVALNARVHISRITMISINLPNDSSNPANRNQTNGKQLRNEIVREKRRYQGARGVLLTWRTERNAAGTHAVWLRPRLAHKRASFANMRGHAAEILIRFSYLC